VHFRKVREIFLRSLHKDFLNAETRKGARSAKQNARSPLGGG
jgi:hypothetical protein